MLLFLAVCAESLVAIKLAIIHANNYQLSMIMFRALVMKFDIGTDCFCNKNINFLIFWSGSKSQSLQIVIVDKVR